MREFFRLRHASTAVAVVVGLLSAALPSAAQQPHELELGGPMQVGGDAERYARVLSLSDTLSRRSWTILPSVVEDRSAPSMALVGHPWASRFARRDSTARFRFLRSMVRGIVNSTFPMQDGIGPAWAGRGATVVVQGGVEANWQRVHLQLAPVAFLAQNAAFPLAANGESGTLAYADARNPRYIDFPQRFGSGAYGRLDAGTSSLDVDLSPLVLGVSTAPERWGPALEYPLVLGPGAGGFPHAYVGSAKPFDLGLGRAQLRFMSGTLAQSDYSAAAPGRTQRFATGAIVSFQPRGLDGLELGFDRFFETINKVTVRRILLPLLPQKLSGSSPLPDQNEFGENQTASAFFRWVMPKGSVEIYGEWFKDDYSSGSVRTFLLVPDDLSAFTLGVQHVLSGSADSRRVFRFEIVNGETSPQARYDRQFLVPIPPYYHTEVVQGHTLRGLMLGSPEAYGGEGWRLSFDHYTPSGRRTFGVERYLRGDWLATNIPATDRVHPDVLYALRAEWLRFAGRRDYTLTLRPALDLNRNLEPGADRFNLNASVTVRGW